MDNEENRRLESMQEAHQFSTFPHYKALPNFLALNPRQIMVWRNLHDYQQARDSNIPVLHYKGSNLHFHFRPLPCKSWSIRYIECKWRYEGGYPSTRENEADDQRDPNQIKPPISNHNIGISPPTKHFPAPTEQCKYVLRKPDLVSSHSHPTPSSLHMCIFP